MRPKWLRVDPAIHPALLRVSTAIVSTSVPATVVPSGAVAIRANPEISPSHGHSASCPPHEGFRQAGLALTARPGVPGWRSGRGAPTVDRPKPSPDGCSQEDRHVGIAIVPGRRTHRHRRGPARHRDAACDHVHHPNCRSARSRNTCSRRPMPSTALRPSWPSRCSCSPCSPCMSAKPAPRERSASSDWRRPSSARYSWPGTGGMRHSPCRGPRGAWPRTRLAHVRRRLGCCIGGLSELRDSLGSVGCSLAWPACEQGVLPRRRSSLGIAAGGLLSGIPLGRGVPDGRCHRGSGRCGVGHLDASARPDQQAPRSPIVVRPAAVPVPQPCEARSPQTGSATSIRSSTMRTG